MAKRTYVPRERRLAVWYAETFHPGRYYATHVRLGSLNPILDGSDLTETQRLALLGSFRRLADLVVYPPPDLWIVEAKVRLQPIALAELEIYGRLAHNTPELFDWRDSPMHLAVVYIVTDALVVSLANEKGILAIQLDPPFKDELLAGWEPRKIEPTLATV